MNLGLSYIVRIDIDKIHTSYFPPFFGIFTSHWFSVAMVGFFSISLVAGFSPLFRLQNYADWKLNENDMILKWLRKHEHFTDSFENGKL